MQPSFTPDDPVRWQQEADLLADGRVVVERLCTSTRFRYLYPDGPSLALLLSAYQEYDRRRTVGRVRGGPWRRRRLFKKIVRAHVRADVGSRSRRLSYGYPLPRLRRLPPPPPVVERALAQVDPDARAIVEAHAGMESMRMGMTLSQDAVVAAAGAAARGVGQFRDALLNEALADPDSIRRLHVQHLHMLATAPPTVRRHPIATLVFVKLPLQLLLGLVMMLVLAYFGAYVFFNDERLGDFVSVQVSGLLEGDLDMKSIHWQPRLIFDLVTGTPSPVVVEDVTVWSPYKRTEHGRAHQAAHAERLEASLVLGEIIPWTRLGIPAFFDIPWVLHFTEVRSDRPVWFDIEEYREVQSDGSEVTVLSLIDAFTPLDPSPTDRRGLSFAVDDAQLGPLALDVDSMAISQWRATAQLDEAAFSLTFEAPDPAIEAPVELPFSFEVRGRGPHGLLQIDDIDLPLTDLVLESLQSNTEAIPAGDLLYRLQARASGSRIEVDGTLRDIFGRLNDPGPEPPSRVDLDATSPDADLLIAHLMAELDLPETTVVGQDSPATASLGGLLSDPIYTLSSEHLSLDLLEESAWVADDVAVSLSMATEAVPGMWEDRFDPGESRSLITFDRFEGTALDGTFALGTRPTDDPRFPDEASQSAHIVMPFFEEDAYLISIPLEVRGFNPAQLVPTDPDLAPTLAGVGTGAVDLEQLIFGPDPAAAHIAEAPTLLERLDVRLGDLTIRRDRGPAQDGLPRDLRLDGRLSLGSDDLVDLDPLTVTTGGTSLRASGALDTQTAALEALLLDLRIDDGEAFARAFGIPSYFDRLRARTIASGPGTSPSATGGSLTIGGLINTGTTTEASFVVNDGRLKLRVDTTDARLFGGQGKVSAEVDVFEGGSVSSNPRIKATASLTGVDLGELSGGLLEGRAAVDLDVGDGEGRPARLDALRVTGEATVPALRFGGTTYRNATVAFALNQDEVAIERLTLPIHRPLSPHFAGDRTVPVGEIVIDGTLTLDDDPALDLDVDAHDVPLATVMRILEVDLGVYGQVASTALHVQGTVSRPRVDGRLALKGLSASGIALGAGTLDVTSEDVPSAGPLSGHRELRIHGELQQGSGPAPIQWSVDTVVAIGTKTGPDGSVPVEAQLDVEFDRVTIATLLKDPVDPARSPPIEGELGEVSAHVLTCSSGAAMLTDCIDVTPSADQDFAVSVAFAVQEAWLRSSTDPLPTGTAPCDSPTTLCADAELAAEIDWPVVRLSQPWTLRSGGPDGGVLSLQGVFDLSDPEPTASTTLASRCVPPKLQNTTVASSVPAGTAAARIEGSIDLAPLAAIARGYGVEGMEGRLDVGVDVAGKIQDPTIEGRASLAPGPGGRVAPLVLALDALPFDITFADLRLQMVDGWRVTDGEASLRGGTVRFGTVDRRNTGYGVTGACAGHFSVGAQGRLSANLLSGLLGPPIVGGPGGVDLRSLYVAGVVAEETDVRALDARLGFDQNALSIEFSEGVTSASFDRGQVDVSLCGADCEFGDEGWYRIDIGGNTTQSASADLPSSALRLSAGNRGRAFAWGRAYIDPDFERSAGVGLQVRLDGLPYRSYDTTGRPVYEVEVTSDDLAITGGTPLVATGSAEVDRARYVKDAVQGVEILAFTDGSPEIEEPPPELLQGMTFDLRVETDRPFRMENNVASGLQADAVVQVTGTYEDPEFTGRLDIEPGGTVDIPFLTGTYEIQRGRVTLLRELEDAEVDVLALRNEPIYIDDQPRSIQLLLSGTLSAIRWSCITDGGGSELDTVRGCTEYLVLGAGDVQLSENDVQQFGAGGLAGVRKPLQVVGHLTEFDVGERAGEAAPRLDPYVPDVRLRLGQIGPELEIATPTEWLDFDYGRATFGWDYTRGYPGFLLRQSREASFKLELLDPITIEWSRRTRSYLNERVIFDPLEQSSIELRFDFNVPTLR
ncbi:MAG: translocation/assembly module TamB domain-containing protein [Myxococcota bacterium]